MRDVAPRLGNRDSGKVTQYLQQQIVADLDKVIEEAKKSEPKNNRLSPVGKAQGGGPKRPNPKKQVEAPRAPVAPSKTDPPIGKSDKDREQELAEARERMKKLFRANLPSHPREHVLEEPSEYFLPEYQLEIEDYFRRLSEDRSDAGTR
jgi:hypothetical protein